MGKNAGSRAESLAAVLADREALRTRVRALEEESERRLGSTDEDVIELGELRRLLSDLVMQRKEWTTEELRARLEVEFRLRGVAEAGLKDTQMALANERARSRSIEYMARHQVQDRNAARKALEREARLDTVVFHVCKLFDEAGADSPLWDLALVPCPRCGGASIVWRNALVPSSGWRLCERCLGEEPDPWAAPPQAEVALAE